MSPSRSRSRGDGGSEIGCSSFSCKSLKQTFKYLFILHLIIIIIRRKIEVILPLLGFQFLHLSPQPVHQRLLLLFQCVFKLNFFAAQLKYKQQRENKNELSLTKTMIFTCSKLHCLFWVSFSNLSMRFNNLFT